MWYTCNMNVPKNLTEQALKDAGIEFTDYANYLIEHHGFVRGMLRGRIGSGDVVHSLCAVYRGMEIATCCSVCHSANWQGGLHIADSTTKITCKKCVMPERKRSERQEMIHTLNTVYGYDTGKIGYANTEQVKWLLWQEIIRAKSGD